MHWLATKAGSSPVKPSTCYNTEAIKSHITVYSTLGLLSRKIVTLLASLAINKVIRDYPCVAD